MQDSRADDECQYPRNQAPLLDVQRIGFSYTAEEKVFEDISLSIQPSEIVVLLGGSGCGKSSLLKVLAGLQAPSMGQVNFAGQAMAKPHPRSALIFQQASLLPWLRVEDNIGFGLDFKHQPNLKPELHRERVSEALTAVGLQHRKRAWPSELSGGQAQRVLWRGRWLNSRSCCLPMSLFCFRCHYPH